MSGRSDVNVQSVELPFSHTRIKGDVFMLIPSLRSASMINI